MNPQYPDSNPYDFIMNPSAPPKKPLNMGGKNAFAIKIGMIIGGVIILMIVIAVGINLLTGGKTSTTDLVSLAQTQQELIRITGQAAGSNGARDQALKNFSTNAELSISTQQLKTLSYLSGKGVKLKAKDLALKENSATTKQLTNAVETSTFDTTFLQIIQTSLSSYSSDLQKYYTNSSNTTVKKLLSTDYEQVQLLKAQLPSTTSNGAATR